MSGRRNACPEDDGEGGGEGVSSQAETGHGYGLFQVRRMARAWGGEASVLRTQVGVGTTLSCRLPYCAHAGGR